MSGLYLITGFLGAGKTTFLKKMLKMFPGKKIHVIINEFGKEGVDGELIRKVGAVLNEINNGSIFCACRLDKFEEVLLGTLQDKPDIIIVEASGLSDPTNVKKIFGQREKFADIEYRGSICLVDARQFLKVYETATVVKKQLNVSDMILLNKIDLVADEKIRQVCEKIHAHRPDIPICKMVYADLKAEWLDHLEQKTETNFHSDRIQNADITLRKYLLVINKNVNLHTLECFLKMIMDDTFRVKGFVCLQGKGYLINCVGNIFEAGLCEIKGSENHLVVLSGYGLPVKKSIKKAMEWYPDVVEKIE